MLQWFLSLFDPKQVVGKILDSLVKLLTKKITDSEFVKKYIVDFNAIIVLVNTARSIIQQIIEKALDEKLSKEEKEAFAKEIVNSASAKILVKAAEGKSYEEADTIKEEIPLIKVG